MEIKKNVGNYAVSFAVGMKVILCAGMVFIFSLATCISYADEPSPTPTPNALENPRADNQAGKAHSWDMPGVVVISKSTKPSLKEDELIGPAAQPRWTAVRRFPSTRVYVQAPGVIQFEYWMRPTIDHDGKFVKIRNQYEYEMGLPSRVQLDLYLTTLKTGNNGPVLFEEVSWELRYALADWGVLPGNPTLYFEGITASGDSDAFESKILLGDEISPRWHWGFNGVFERKIGGDLGQEYKLTGGVSYTVVDTKFSVGAETTAAFEDTRFNRGAFEKTYLAGPSLQWRPAPEFHIDVAGLMGLTKDSPMTEPLIVTGWEF